MCPKLAAESVTPCNFQQFYHPLPLPGVRSASASVSVKTSASQALILILTLISSTICRRRRSSATWFWLERSKLLRKREVWAGPGCWHRCSAEQDTFTVECAAQVDSSSTSWWQHENTAGKVFIPTCKVAKCPLLSCIHVRLCTVCKNNIFGFVTSPICPL